MTKTHRSSATRRGFTLVELLVVIAILAVLASLVAAGIQRTRVAQMRSNSETTVGKVQHGVDGQVTAINEGVARERRDGSQAYGALLTFCGGDADRAVALLTYCRVKQAFPISTAELATTMTAAPLAGQPGFTLGGANFPWPKAFFDNSLPGIGTDPDQVPAALVYVALTRRTIQGYTFPVDDGIGNEAGDVLLNSISCRVFLDGWKHPISLRRWFTSAELNAPPYVNPKDFSKDPFDPRGRLYTADPASTWATTNRAIAESTLGVTFSPDNKQLVVYSAGQNERYDGLGADDILGFRLRSIGQKGSK